MLFVRYAFFAIVSTLANLAIQEAVFKLAAGVRLAADVRLPAVAPLSLSILAGTAVGFAVKYVLDKKWIFYDDYAGGRQELRKVTIYGIFSVITTLVFWGFEVAFWTVWRTDTAKYMGAVLGLAIGYAAKYALDRTFVFRDGRT